MAANAIILRVDPSPPPAPNCAASAFKSGDPPCWAPLAASNASSGLFVVVVVVVGIGRPSKRIDHKKCRVATNNDSIKNIPLSVLTF